MLSLFHDYEHTVKITIALLDRLNVNFTRLSVNEELQRHPDYPSLFSISAMLTKRKVDNMALQVDPEKLEELPTPFIAHTHVAGGSFLLVTSVNGAITYINEHGKEREKSKDAFLKEWTSKVLLVESTPASGEKNYAGNRRRELFSMLRVPVVIATCSALILFYAASHTPALWPSVLLMIKLAGCIVSGILVWFEIDKFNPALKNFCSPGKNTNCEAILNSKQAKVFNTVSWSEIGFVYFTTGFLFLLLQPDIVLSISVLSWLNLLALPYTVFSVVYQWIIARQWCKLCLIIQGLLILEASVFYFAHGYPGINTVLSVAGTFYMVVSLSLVVLFLIFVKPVLKKALAVHQLAKENSRIKYKPEVFGTLLRGQKQITASAEGLGITLGNPLATQTIIQVCNPYCRPCAAAHRELDELLDNNPGIKLQIIFTATTDERDARYLPVKHFMALYSMKDGALTRQALHDWYGSNKMDYSAFSVKYQLSGEQEQQDSGVSAMEKWCNTMGIHATPTFFFNGFQLPKEYGVEDLKYLFN